MPRISQQKQDKISEQILALLYNKSPEPQFTSKIAEEIVRDEEFTKKLLTDLKKKKLIIEIDKNPKGIQYLRRQRWRLSNTTYEAYRNYQG